MTAPKGVDPRFCSPKGEPLMDMNTFLTVKFLPNCMYSVAYTNIVLGEEGKINHRVAIPVPFLQDVAL